jgi:hypothetical protein
MKDRTDFDVPDWDNIRVLRSRFLTEHPNPSDARYTEQIEVTNVGARSVDSSTNYHRLLDWDILCRYSTITKVWVCKRG